MNTPPALNGAIAANKVHHWLRAWYGADVPEAIDLDVVRQMLPTTPYGKGVREIRPPVQFNDDAFEGMLARDPGDPEVWGIAYNGAVSPQRQRFTIAHAPSSGTSSCTATGSRVSTVTRKASTPATRRCA